MDHGPLAEVLHAQYYGTERQSHRELDDKGWVHLYDDGVVYCGKEVLTQAQRDTLFDIQQAALKEHQEIEDGGHPETYWRAFADRIQEGLEAYGDA
jgi:hypothetical protein